MYGELGDTAIQTGMVLADTADRNKPVPHVQG